MKTKISLILLFMLYVGLLLFWYKLTLGSTSAIGGVILLFLFFIALIFVAAIDWILLKKLLGKNIIIVLEITLLFLLFLIYSVNTASFYYNGNVGGTDIQDGVIVMDIANNGSTANGIHESSHGFDLWKKGRPNERTAIPGEIKAYSRQFSFDPSSVPTSDFGRANSLSDINHRWVLGINNGGNYLYIRFVYPNRNPKDVLKLIK